MDNSCTYGKTVVRWHGESDGRTGAQVVDLVLRQTEREETIDGSRYKAAVRAKLYPGHGNSCIRTSRRKWRAGCRNGSAVTGMDRQRGHSSRCSLSLVLPPNDPSVWTFWQIVLLHSHKGHARGPFKGERRRADRLRFRRIPRAALLLVGCYASISTSVRE